MFLKRLSNILYLDVQFEWAYSRMCITYSFSEVFSPEKFFLVINLQSFLLKCGTRPYEWGPQWNSTSFMKVCESSLLTITPNFFIYETRIPFLFIHYKNIINVCVPGQM